MKYCFNSLDYYLRVLGDLSLGVKRPEREVDHSPPSTAVAKNSRSYYLHFPIRLHGVVLN